MNILSQWIRSYVPGLTLADRELAEALTLRGIAVEGILRSWSGRWLALRDGHHHQPGRCHESLRHRARGSGDRGLVRWRRSTSHCPHRSRGSSHQGFHRSSGTLRALHGAGSQRCAYPALGWGGRRALRTAAAETHLERCRRHQLRHPRHRPSHPRLRSRQARRRHHFAPRPQRRKTPHAGWSRTCARCRRPRGRRRKESPRPSPASWAAGTR